MAGLCHNRGMARPYKLAPIPPNTLTHAEAASLLDVGHRTLYRYVEAKRLRPLPMKATGGYTRYHVEDVRKLARRKVAK